MLRPAPYSPATITPLPALEQPLQVALGELRDLMNQHANVLFCLLYGAGIGGHSDLCSEKTRPGPQGTCKRRACHFGTNAI